MEQKKEKVLVGWAEWCSLPGLHVVTIKAKIDTGARTSAIHAFNIEPYKFKKKDYVRFSIHPIQHNDNVIIHCKAPVLDKRHVMSSSGHQEERFVISTPLKLANQSWEIELTLTNRDLLRFRMLLGREALKIYTLIDPSQQFKQGKIKKEEVIKLYKKIISKA